MLSTQELQRCSQKGTDWWDLSQVDIDDIQEDLESGSDAYLKLLLIASCPRLHSVRFVRRLGDTYSSLSFIERAIRWSLSRYSKWAPGFKSLQNVAVGVSNGSLHHNDDCESAHGSVLAALLNLPHLKNLYFYKPFQNFEEEYQDDYPEFHETYNFPTGTSSVESIFLDSPGDLFSEFYDALTSAAKELDTLAFRAESSYARNGSEVNSLVEALSRKNPQLKRLIVYNGRGFYDGGCLSYSPSVIKCFEAIKHFSIAAYDIEDEGYDRAYGRDPDIVRSEWFHQAFPPNIEAIHIWGNSDYDGYETAESEPLDLLLSQIIESGAYKDLKVIYVENVERWDRPSVQTTLTFQKTVAAGRKAGVNVCTLTNKDDGGYRKNFPAKPDRFDFKTGPCGGERPADWRLNLYTGEWGPDCMGCGECEECLAVYPAELWNKSTG
ncbi:hypothetical protein ACHAPY_004293 [Fusarium culmorum]